MLLLLLPILANAATVNLEGGDSKASCEYATYTNNAGNFVFACVPKVTPPVTPPANCPAAAPVIPGPYTGTPIKIPVNGTVSFQVPVVPGGYAQVIQDAATPPSTKISLYFSRCPGIPDDLKDSLSPPNQFGPTNKKPCQVTGNYTGATLWWSVSAITTSVCKTPQRVYLNISVGASCVPANTSAPLAQCPLKIQWNPT